jgi:ABC-type multidrug transport system fused ATPase/permease subunit
VLVKLIDDARQGSLDAAALYWAFPVLLACVIAQWVFAYLANRDGWISTFKMFGEVRARALDHLRRLPMRSHTQRPAGDTVTTLTQDVNAVVQEFLDDDVSRAALTGHQAKIRLETAIGTDGNVFIALFTNPLTGKVTPRTLPFDEIVDKISVEGDLLVVELLERGIDVGVPLLVGNVPHEGEQPVLDGLGQFVR